MRHRLALAALATVLATPAAMAQPPAVPAPAPPRLFAATGYSQPPIPASACRVVSPSGARCQAPAMTAGMYLVRAAGTSTAANASAAQQLVIAAGDKSCSSTWRPSRESPWPAGRKRTFRSACLITIITDAPLSIEVAYLDQGAVKDPGGPQVTVTPMPWSGAIGAIPVKVSQ